MRASTRSGGSTAVFTTADQVLSSASNALMVFAVALVSSPQQFGTVALLVTVATTCIGFNRGALGTVLLLTSNLSRREITSEAGYAVAWSLSTAILPGGALVLAGAAFGQLWLGLAFGISLVAVLAQDVFRFAAIALARPQVAAVWDGLWVLWILAIYLANLIGWKVSAPVTVWLWGLGGAISALGLATVLGFRPRWHRQLSWWRRYGRARARFGIVYALNQIGATLVTLTATVVVGSAAAAGLRGGATLFGPIAMLVAALPLVFVPHARRTAATPRQQWGVLLKTSVLTSGLTLLAGIGLSVVPDRLGAAVLGETWSHASALVVYLGVECAAMCWMVSVYSFFQAQGMSRTVLPLKVFQVTFQIAVSLGAGLVWGTPTAIAVALAVSGTTTAVLGVVLVARAVRRAGNDDDGDREGREGREVCEGPAPAVSTGAEVLTR